MHEVVSIICFLIFFIIILWVYNYSKRKKNIRDKEPFWGKIKGFFKNTYNQARQHLENMARMARERAAQVNRMARAKAEEVLRLRREAEAAIKRNNMIAQFRAALARDFNLFDTVPTELKQYLLAEIENAKRLQKEFLEKQELDRKRNGYKVIKRLQELAKSFPSRDAANNMVFILEGKDTTYPISSIKGKDTINTMLDILRKPDISLGDYDELKVMADILREYNCNGDQWCFAEKSQWKYKRS